MTPPGHHTVALHAAAWALKTSDPSETLHELLNALGIRPARRPRLARPDRVTRAVRRPPIDAELYARVQAAHLAGTHLDQIAEDIGRSHRATERLLAGYLVGPLRPGQPDPRPRASGYLSDPEARARWMNLHAPDYIAPLTTEPS